MRWPDSNAGSSAISGSCHTSSRRMCWSTRCAAARRPGPAFASISNTCPRRYGRGRSRSIRTTILTRALRGPENRRELGGRRDLELVVAAVLGSLVGAPALEDRRVAEAVALQMVVLDLAHALDAQRFPRE